MRDIVDGCDRPARRAVLGRASVSRRARPRDLETVEKHDDRVLAFATRLGSGRHDFSYLVRATTAATVAAPDAPVEAMYEPALEGGSAVASVTI